MKYAYLGFGSNMGDREGYISRAKNLLIESGIDIVAESSMEETDPVDYTEQPRFINQVAKVTTAMKPDELLSEISRIENSLGRVRTIDKGPRTIDIDILLYGDMIYRTEKLEIPHHAILDRDFVLRHIIQIDETVRDPRDNRKLSEVYHEKFRNKISS
ncbi:MAG TPA: 2-amino-4-hydroxy-6-hydroxymethyldihydropteridine diphosphokinase [Spirochaetota bacterium]|nr:2-amino-4-hydroxy-6-hydroxymethyldihydropteridine diphosphokinase [Spirochaetota bacterium]